MPKHRIVLLASKDVVANEAASLYWSKYCIVITSPMMVKLLCHFVWNPLTRLDLSKYAFAINKTSEFPKIQKIWSNRPPLIQVKHEDIYRGQIALEQLGVTSDKWFVCINSRDGGYSPNDEKYHNFRNCSINDYLLAAEFIKSIGGIGIIMGDSTMSTVPKIDGLIDYAHHQIRSDWLDLYIAARCRFFLGNTSGAYQMSFVFGVPVATANMTPLGSLYPGGNKDIAIPKLYKDVYSGRLLSFREILDSPISNFRFSSQFAAAGVELVNNSPEEIRDLAIEQLERITNPNFAYEKEDDVLQIQFRELFKLGHYSFGSASRVGRAFLKQYNHLL